MLWNCLQWINLTKFGHQFGVPPQYWSASQSKISMPSKTEFIKYLYDFIHQTKKRHSWFLWINTLSSLWFWIILFKQEVLTQNLALHVNLVDLFCNNNASANTLSYWYSKGSNQLSSCMLSYTVTDLIWGGSLVTSIKYVKFDINVSTNQIFLEESNTKLGIRN